MGAQIQAFDIFQTHLSSHYPLPLSRKSRICFPLIKKTYPCGDIVGGGAHGLKELEEKKVTFQYKLLLLLVL
jgi:hypothetical protein